MDRSAARRISLAAGLLVISYSAMAAAERWNYELTCTDQLCGPGTTGAKETVGPFSSFSDCDSARSADERGNMTLLDFCVQQTSAESTDSVATGAGSMATGSGGERRPRTVHLEVGMMAGPGWQATGEGGTSTQGPGTLGLAVESRTGRDFGGAFLELGLLATWLKAPMLGDESHAYYGVPVSVGLVFTPRIYHRGARSVRANVGGSVGGLFQFGCSACAGPVFQETMSFGYTLNAGVDVYFAPTTGVSIDVVFPRWQIGSAVPGNLSLESPFWMLRVSLISRLDRT